MFKKVLIANRGEIAVRLIRALRELDIASVAVFSEVDRLAPHVLMSDEAVAIGPAASRKSYLAIENILAAARATGAEAIHPGYGFLSENADFARACQQAHIVFIGPSPEAIAAMGSKTAARRVAMAAGAPIVPGTETGVDGLPEAQAAAGQIGYPVLLKAAAGGGGKGMRRVDSARELESAMQAASSEALNAFGSSEIYLEKWIERPRHVEIQILGDQHGNLIHLGERECSIQRRHQKVIEECPSPLSAVHPQLRQRMGDAALRIARQVHYAGAGTLEFLANDAGDFYFLEMNTRLQVEHPVTELVTGVDLVHWQIRIAAGERLTLRQPDIHWRGAALECRVYAEDPANNFFPSPGTIEQYAEPGGPGVRVDSGVYAGYTVPLEYDPMLAKLCTWGETREVAIERMRRAVSEYHISGITVNLPLYRKLLRDEVFVAGSLHTGFLPEFFARSGGLDARANGPAADGAVRVQSAALLAASQVLGTPQRGAATVNGARPSSMWRIAGRTGLLR